MLWVEYQRYFFLANFRGTRGPQLILQSSYGAMNEEKNNIERKLDQMMRVESCIADLDGDLIKSI